MKLDDIINCLKSYVESGDVCTFVGYFLTDETNRNHLDSIYKKIREYIYFFINDLPQTEDRIMNVLQILMELIQMFKVEDDDLAVHLSKTVLLVITEEDCSIANIKRAIHVFNLLIQKPDVLFAVTTDARHEGSLQILGRRVPSTGDYECQALMFEVMYRITSLGNRQYWVNIWFSDALARNMFMNLDPLKFESNCRRLLNYINRNEPSRRVFSFIAGSVSFGSYQLSEPSGCELWVDFNYDSQSISFYSSEITFNESANDSELWETILISDSSVKSYSIIEKKSEKTKEVILLLNCPCHTLITSSNILNSAFNSYKVSIVVWDILDIYEHLVKIYGKDKYMQEELILRDVTETEDVPINLQVLSSEMSTQRKVSNLSDPIPVDACETEDVIPGTDQNLNVAVFRKISQTTETIHISSEILSENIKSQNYQKISASSEVIQIKTAEVVEGLCEKGKSSMSVEAIICDTNNDILQKSNLLDKLPEVTEVTACPKRKASSSVGLKIEKEENYIPTQKRKRKMRLRTKKKQSMKISPSSSGSLNRIKDNSNLNDRVGSMLKESENLLKNNKSVRKSPTLASKINSPSDELKSNVHISNEYEDKEDVLAVDTVDICKSDEMLKMDTEDNKESKISSDSPSCIGETLNEKVISFNKYIQSDHKSTSDSHISPLVPQDTLMCNKKLEKEEATNDNKNQDKEKQSSTSSKETDNCEMTLKGNLRRVRLYNLESAPVYDVPPLFNSNNPAIQDSTCNKPISNIGQENYTNGFEHGVNSHELQDKQKKEPVAKKVNAKRKSSSSKSVEDAVKGKEIKLFADPSGSENDFQESGRRNSYKRRGGNRFTSSAATNRQNSKCKRKLQESSYCDSEISNRKPAKIPRTAAVRARRRTKEILDSTFVITCDKIEVMTDSTEDGPTMSGQNESKVKSKKGSKSNTDTETQSSEVSWMKQKNSTYLFETPKKNYSERRKNLQEKKKLPIEIIPGSKSSIKEPPYKKRKNVISTNSETKSKSGWSDLENYNLTIEKDTKRHHVLNALAADFQSISTSRNSAKKSFHSHSHVSVYDMDSYFEDNLMQQPEMAVEIEANDEHITDGLIKICDDTNDMHNTKSNFEKSCSVERNPNKEYNHNNILNDDTEGEIVVCNSNCFNVDEHITPVIDLDKLIQEENDKKKGKNSSEHSVEDSEGTSAVLDDREKYKSNDYLQEIKDKHFILQRFFKSISEYSGTQSDSIAVPQSETVMNLSSLQSTKSLLNDTVSAKLSKNSEFPGRTSNPSISHSPVEKSDITMKQNNKIKSKANESFVNASKAKKYQVLSSAQKLDKRGKCSIKNELTKRVNLKHALNLPEDPTANRNVKVQRSLDKVVGEKIVPISKEFCGSERSFRKHKHFQQSKGFSDHSFNSLHSKLAPPSVIISENDKTWFDTITLALSQDANNLSRKLLATVQKCFCEFIAKMNTLRENIINTSNEFEMPPYQNVSNNELKYFVKNCKIVRLEVEKSLRRMLDAGKQYFEAEERCFRKIKRKHIKASRKFISKMRGAQQKSIRMLEGKVLLETKFHLKKILKHIKSV